MKNDKTNYNIVKPEEQPEQRTRRGEIGRLLRNTFVFLTLTALVTLVVFSLWLNAFRIDREDMSPVLRKGDIVLAVKKSMYTRDDVIAFYHNNDIFIKRIIAIGGDEVIIDENGTVFVNGVNMDDEYAVNPGTGDCDITFPYQVPEGRFFVLGDNRGVSSDSRLKKIGTVSDTLIIGKVLFDVWPFSSIGIIE